MKDPYVYEGTNVLINKAGFKEQSSLDEFESTMTKIATINLSMSGFKYQSVQDIFKIHKQVFEKVYDWAGQPRTINIYKSEYEHLEAILSDSISFKIETKNHDKRYQTIKGYDLSKYQYNYHSAENPNK